MATAEDWRTNLLFLPYLMAFVLCTYLATIILCRIAFDTKDYSIFRRIKYHKRYKKRHCISLWQICRDCYSCFCCCCLCDEHHWCGVSVPLLYTETLYNSIIGFVGNFLLLITRIVSFLFLFYYVVYSFPQHVNKLNSFSSWNAVTMCLLFALLTLTSFVGTASRFHRQIVTHQQQQQPQHTDNPHDGKEGPIWLQRLLVPIHFLYEIAGTNALFITIIEYCYIQRHTSTTDTLSFNDLKYHLIPTVFICFEMLFNIIPFRLEHYYYTLSLPIGYLLYQWIGLMNGTMDLQYTFLQTSRSNCFGNYSVLFGIHIACFMSWMLLHKVRDFVGKVPYQERYRILMNKYDDLEEGEGDEEEGDDRMNDEGKCGSDKEEGEEFDGKDDDDEEEEENVHLPDVYASVDADHHRFIGSYDSEGVPKKKKGSKGRGEFELPTILHPSVARRDRSGYEPTVRFRDDVETGNDTHHRFEATGTRDSISTITSPTLSTHASNASLHSVPSDNRINTRIPSVLPPIVTYDLPMAVPVAIDAVTSVPSSTRSSHKNVYF
jgi:signal transduction histidine kinase